MKKSLFLLIFLSISSTSVFAKETQQCATQVVGDHTSTLCLHDPGMFQHWIFSLVVDGQLILNVVDDFAEAVKLTHTIPPGLALELPLSKGEKGQVELVGGCLPESKGDVEIARICNFRWGGVKIIDDVRFEHALRRPPGE